MNESQPLSMMRWLLDRKPFCHWTGTSWRSMHSPTLFALAKALQPNAKHWPPPCRSLDQPSLSDLKDLRHQFQRDGSSLAHEDHGAGPRGWQGARRSAPPGATRHRTVSAVAKSAITPEKEAEAIVRMLRTLSPHGRLLELGTSLGIMSAHLLRSGWNVETWEGCPNTLTKAQEGWEALGVSHQIVSRQGRFDRLLASCRADAMWDVVYLDGHHEGQATLDLLDALEPRVRVGVIVDDIAWTLDMHKAWEMAKNKPGWRVAISWAGRGILLKGEHMSSQHVRLGVL